MTWKSTEIALPGTVENFLPSRFWPSPDGRHVVVEEVCWEPRSARLRVYVAGEEGLLPHGTIELGEEHTPSFIVTSEAVAWWKDGRMNAASLSGRERIAAPPGCVLAGGYPASFGAAAEHVAAKPWRTYVPFLVSPDARFFAVAAYRREVDVIFATEPVEEAKALAKKQRVLALSNDAVVVATKPTAWSLLATGTWKKLGAGECKEGIREARFSPDGAYLALASGKTITIVDAQTAAVVTEETMSNTVECLGWITAQRLVRKLDNKEGQGLAETYGVLDPALPVRAPVAAAAASKAPAKKTKAKPSRSAELGLPFELAWSQPEPVLRDFIKGKPHGVSDRALAEAEAAILDPTYRGEATLFGNYSGSLAAALLLRAPACAAYFDELLAKHLDDEHVQAVLPRLSESGKGRLACTYVLAGRDLDAAQRRALSRFVVLDVWNSNVATKVTPPDTSGRLSNMSTYARIESYCRAHGDLDAFAEAMHALFELGRAKSIEGHDVEFSGDFASFAAALAKNPAHARAALARRASSPAGAKDKASDVAAWMRFAENEPVKAGDARAPQLAYALTVCAREGLALPHAARAWLVLSTPTSEVEARALALLQDDASDSALTQAWVAAVRGDATLEARLKQLFVNKPDAAVLALVDFIVANAPLHEAHRLAMTMIGLPQLDMRAFKLLMRARDAGALPEDASWFTRTAGTAWDRSAPLATCSEATQKAVVAHWLEAGRDLPWAAKFDFEGAAREAILRADLNAITAMFSKERMGEWMPLLRQHIPASKDADGVLTRLRYAGPDSAALENLRKLALGEETPPSDDAAPPRSARHDRGRAARR